MGLRRSLALGALLAAAFAAAAGAGPNDDNRGPAVPGSALLPAPPPTTYDAVVDRDGNLQKGNASSAFRIKTGTYIVRFPAGMTQCIYVATLGRATTDGGVAAKPGMISVVRSSGFVDGVFLETRDARARPHDFGFHLVVAC